MDDNLKARVHSLEQRLIQKGRELSLLKEMSLFLTYDLQKTLDLLAYRINVLTNAKFVRIYLLDRTSTKLRLVSGYNLSEKYLEMVKDRLEVSIDAVPCGKAVIEKAPYIVNDVAKDDAFALWRNVTAIHGYSSYIAMPLIVSERIIGVADIFFEDVRYFSDDEINLISVLSNTGALVIENAMLMEKMEQISIVDEETGAYNDRHFTETLRKEVERAKRYNHPISIIMMQIKEPSHANEPFETISIIDAHDSIRAFASDVMRKVRGCDMFFRHSSDSFCLLLPQTVKRDSAEFVMTRVYESFNRIFGKDMVLSVGISGFPEDGDNAETLIKRALDRD